VGDVNSYPTTVAAAWFIVLETHRMLAPHLSHFTTTVQRPVYKEGGDIWLYFRACVSGSASLACRRSEKLLCYETHMSSNPTPPVHNQTKSRIVS